MTSTLAWEATPAYVIGLTRETSAAIKKKLSYGSLMEFHSNTFEDYCFGLIGAFFDCCCPSSVVTCYWQFSFYRLHLVLFLSRLGIDGHHFYLWNLGLVAS
jgi:hypothetical protein